MASWTRIRDAGVNRTHIEHLFTLTWPQKSASMVGEWHVQGRWVDIAIRDFVMEPVECLRQQNMHNPILSLERLLTSFLRSTTRPCATYISAWLDRPRGGQSSCGSRRWWLFIPMPWLTAFLPPSAPCLANVSLECSRHRDANGCRSPGSC